MYKLSTLTLRYMYLLAARLRMLTTMKYLNIQKRDIYFIFPVIGLNIYRIFYLLSSYFVPQNICGILRVNMCLNKFLISCTSYPLTDNNYNYNMLVDFLRIGRTCFLAHDLQWQIRELIFYVNVACRTAEIITQHSSSHDLCWRISTGRGTHLIDL